MGGFTIVHWLIVLTVVIVFVAGGKIREIMRRLGGGPRGGPPTHPLPVTSSIETSRPSRKPDGSSSPKF